MFCKNPADIRCNNPDCPIKLVYDFFNSNKCPKGGCQHTSEDILYKKQQKLVDTMIASDIFFLCNYDNNPIFIVSSDDDMWPPIYSAILSKKTVFHIQTNDNNVTLNEYTKNINSGYRRLYMNSK